ncbi:HRAS-like suppressor 2 [Poecilia latipinna]|uniref:HRAS-like suppressor 2 n=1 Tax=Poecilia latipinna TaxID=48699 RepID=UPI00072E0F37|nr:PREDICTED: HRAS-like suppressor 2 [Poecilia latipinna]
MDRLGNWSSSFSQLTTREVDRGVSTAETGDLIEFVNPWLGLSLWGVYTGEGYVIHFWVGESAGGASQIRVNNHEHNLTASPPETVWRRCETFLHQEFKYNLLNFNSEHFAAFVRYGHAVSNQVGKILNVGHTKYE